MPFATIEKEKKCYHLCYKISFHCVVYEKTLDIVGQLQINYGITNSYLCITNGSELGGATGAMAPLVFWSRSLKKSRKVSKSKSRSLEWHQLFLPSFGANENPYDTSTYLLFLFFFNLLFSRAFQLSINFLFLKSDKKYYPFLILHSSSICYFLYQMAPFLQGIMLRMNLLFLKSEAMLAYYSFSIHSSYPTTIQVPFLFSLYWMAICIVHFFFCIPL